MAGSGGWSPASCQEVLPESLNSGWKSGPWGSWRQELSPGCPPPHPSPLSLPDFCSLGILSQQLRQDAHWVVLPSVGWRTWAPR